MEHTPNNYEIADESGLEITDAATGVLEKQVDRRGALGIIGGAMAAVAAMGAGAGSAEAGRRDRDSADYIRRTQAMIDSWYSKNKTRVFDRIFEMQKTMDSTGRKPEMVTEQIDLPRSAESTFSRARMEISWHNDYQYKVKYFVTERNGDVDCGERIITIRPTR